MLIMKHFILLFYNSLYVGINNTAILFLNLKPINEVMKF